MSTRLVDTTTEVASLLSELARHKRLVKKLRDPANWTRDRWTPVAVRDSTDILMFIDQELNENQSKLSV